MGWIQTSYCALKTVIVCRWNEATHGVSGVTAVNTAMPITTSCYFNRSLWKATGNMIAREGRAYANAENRALDFWTPVINIVRLDQWRCKVVVALTRSIAPPPAATRAGAETLKPPEKTLFCLESMPPTLFRCDHWWARSVATFRGFDFALAVCRASNGQQKPSTLSKRRRVANTLLVRKVHHASSEEPAKI